MRAITTFPGDMWDVYAHDFLQTYAEFWEIPLSVYWQDGPYGYHNLRIDWLYLNRVPGYQEFLSKAPEGHAKWWAPKVYAQFDAFERYAGQDILWLDADIVTRCPVPKRTLDKIFAHGSYLKYQGRRGAYTDASMIAFNTGDPEFPAFAERYRSLYEDGGLFELRGPTDADALDAAREGAGYNLTPNVHGSKDAFAQGPLSMYCEHLKGKRKFAKSNAEGRRV